MHLIRKLIRYSAVFRVCTEYESDNSVLYNIIIPGHHHGPEQWKACQEHHRTPWSTRFIPGASMASLEIAYRNWVVEITFFGYFSFDARWHVDNVSLLSSILYCTRPMYIHIHLFIELLAFVCSWTFIRTITIL